MGPRQFAFINGLLGGFVGGIVCLYLLAKLLGAI